MTAEITQEVGSLPLDRAENPRLGWWLLMGVVLGMVIALLL